LATIGWHDGWKTHQQFEPRKPQGRRTAEGLGVMPLRVRRILEALDGHDRIDSELKDVTDLERHSICSARGQALTRGLIVAVGERAGPTAFSQTEWRLTEKGRAALC
jgi:hypothetical protein